MFVPYVVIGYLPGKKCAAANKPMPALTAPKYMYVQVYQNRQTRLTIPMWMTTVPATVNRTNRPQAFRQSFGVRRLVPFR